MPLVYIVLVNYKGYEDTVKCLQSLSAITYHNVKVIVVDNASVDGSFEKLQQEFKMVDFIDSSDNLGFAGGNNLGIELALSMGADYIMLLNNDTEVEADFIERMLESFEKNLEAGIVGGRIMYFDERDKISHAGGEIDFFKFTTSHYGMDEELSAATNYEKEVSFISGCLMLIKREVFEKIGLLQDDYFMYYEDTDFCVRACEKGFKLIYTPQAIIYHKISASSGGEDSPFFIKWSNRNRRLFMRRFKHKTSAMGYSASLCYYYATRSIRWLKYLIKGDSARRKAIAEGMREGRGAR